MKSWLPLQRSLLSTVTYSSRQLDKWHWINFAYLRKLPTAPITMKISDDLVPERFCLALPPRCRDIRLGKKLISVAYLEKTFLSEVCHYGKNNQHCACTHVQFKLAHRATCSTLHMAHSSIARNSADMQIEVLVHHESSTCWTNKKRADWPQLSQTVHVLNRFCWTDWLKTSPIVSSRSTLRYITLLYTLERLWDFFPIHISFRGSIICRLVRPSGLPEGLTRWQ